MAKTYTRFLSGLISLCLFLQGPASAWADLYNSCPTPMASGRIHVSALNQRIPGVYRGVLGAPRIYHQILQQMPFKRHKNHRRWFTSGWAFPIMTIAILVSHSFTGNAQTYRPTEAGSSSQRSFSQKGLSDLELRAYIEDLYQKEKWQKALVGIEQQLDQSVGDSVFVRVLWSWVLREESKTPKGALLPASVFRLKRLLFHQDKTEGVLKNLFEYGVDPLIRLQALRAIRECIDFQSENPPASPSAEELEKRLERSQTGQQEHSFHFSNAFWVQTLLDPVFSEDAILLTRVLIEEDGILRRDLIGALLNARASAMLTSKQETVDQLDRVVLELFGNKWIGRFLGNEKIQESEWQQALLFLSKNYGSLKDENGVSHLTVGVDSFEWLSWATGNDSFPLARMYVKDGLIMSPGSLLRELFFHRQTALLSQDPMMADRYEQLIQEVLTHPEVSPVAALLNVDPDESMELWPVVLARLSQYDSKEFESLQKAFLAPELVRLHTILDAKIAPLLNVLPALHSSDQDTARNVLEKLKPFLSDELKLKVDEVLGNLPEYIRQYQLKTDALMALFKKGGATDEINLPIQMFFDKRFAEQKTRILTTLIQYKKPSSSSDSVARVLVPSDISVQHALIALLSQSDVAMNVVNIFYAQGPTNQLLQKELVKTLLTLLPQSYFDQQKLKLKLQNAEGLYVARQNSNVEPTWGVGDTTSVTSQQAANVRSIRAIGQNRVPGTRAQERTLQEWMEELLGRYGTSEILFDLFEDPSSIIFRNRLLILLASRDVQSLKTHPIVYQRLLENDEPEEEALIRSMLGHLSDPDLRLAWLRRERERHPELLKNPIFIRASLAALNDSVDLNVHKHLFDFLSRVPAQDLSPGTWQRVMQRLLDLDVRDGVSPLLNSQLTSNPKTSLTLTSAILSLRNGMANFSKGIFEKELTLYLERHGADLWKIFSESPNLQLRVWALRELFMAADQYTADLRKIVQQPINLKILQDATQHPAFKEDAELLLFVLKLPRSSTESPTSTPSKPSRLKAVTKGALLLIAGFLGMSFLEGSPAQAAVLIPVASSLSLVSLDVISAQNGVWSLVFFIVSSVVMGKTLSHQTSYQSGKERMERLRRHFIWKYIVPRADHSNESVDQHELTPHERRWIQLLHAPWTWFEYESLRDDPRFFLLGHETLSGEAKMLREKHALRIQRIIKSIAPQSAAFFSVLVMLNLLGYLILRPLDAHPGVMGGMLGVAFVFYLLKDYYAGRVVSALYHFVYNLLHPDAALTSSNLPPDHFQRTFQTAA